MYQAVFVGFIRWLTKFKGTLINSNRLISMLSGILFSNLLIASRDLYQRPLGIRSERFRARLAT